MWSERALWFCFFLLGFTQIMTYGVFYISPELYRAGVTAPFDNLLLVCGALLSYMCLWNMAYEKGLKQFSSMTGILSVLSDLEDIEGE